MNITYFNNLQKFTIKNFDNNNRSIDLYTLTNCTLYGLSEYYPDILIKCNENNQLIIPIKESFMSLNKDHTYDTNLKYNFVKPEHLYDNFIDCDLFYFIYNVDNYYHFIYDTLPYLYGYLHLKKTNNTLKLLSR